MKKSFVVVLTTMVFLILIFNFIFQKVYASNEEEIQSQQKEFGIQDFLKSSKEYYSGEFFEGMDMSDFLNSAIQGQVDNSTIGKRVLNLLGSEFVNAIKAIGSILVIIVIHSVLKSISEGLENDNISKLIYYAQYILIITIILANFSEIVKMVQDTTTNLVGFMNLLVPLLITLMTATGNFATSRNDRAYYFIYDSFYRKYNTKCYFASFDGVYRISNFVKAFRPNKNR